MWCIPGSTLPNASGWKFWYCNQGVADFEPAQPKVYLCSNPSSGNPTKQADLPCEVTLTGDCLPEIDGLGRRIFIAEIAITNATAGEYYWLEIPESSTPFILQIQPKVLPREGLNFILNSCFWRNDDKTGHYARATQAIMDKVRPRPSFKFLVGDQIYLDYPLIFQDSREHIRSRYLEYFGDPYYQEVLGACPNYLTCDDHEYWNNFPDIQAQLPYTYTESHRKAFTQVADDCYDQFQGRLNPNNKSWYSFDIEPVSFFTIDTRAKRTEKNDSTPKLMDEEQWLALENWQRQLKGPGILTVGQPIFQKDGNWTDYSLSNFPDDYGRLLKIIQSSFNGDNDEGKRHDIVILTGDIHHSRHASGWLGPDQELHEFVSSPTSRVGPFVFKAKYEELPSVINAKYKNTSIKITKIKEVDSASLALFNHSAVINLIPVADRRVEIDFSIYQIRPLTEPSWNIFSNKKKQNRNNPTFQRSYSSSQVKKIILQ